MYYCQLVATELTLQTEYRKFCSILVNSARWKTLGGLGV